MESNLGNFKDLKILVVDDDDDILFTMNHLLSSIVNTVKCISNPEEIEVLVSEFDILFLDMNYRFNNTNGKEGFSWLNKTLKKFPDLSITMMTNHSSLDLAVRCIHEGASDFISKPIIKDKILKSIERTMKLKNNSNNMIVSRNFSDKSELLGGESEQIKSIIKDLNKIASTSANVLILGENGTGKELAARMLHENSKRSGQEFLNVDVGSVNEGVFESELFGHKKGSFTDAKEDRIGYFEAASEGTLFLDEIGNLALNLQSKLLKVLQEKVIRRVGDSGSIKVNPRLIFATNMDLYELVKRGEFREDLLYRINTVEMKMPALRNRKEDIPFLANHFLDKYQKEHNREIEEIAPDAMEILCSHTWPGNIRELQHAIERVIILSEGKQINCEDFQFLNSRIAEKSKNSVNIPQSLTLESNEKSIIEAVLKSNRLNISKAADELGISRYTLYRKMKKFGLSKS